MEKHLVGKSFTTVEKYLDKDELSKAKILFDKKREFRQKREEIEAKRKTYLTEL